MLENYLTSLIHMKRGQLIIIYSLLGMMSPGCETEEAFTPVYDVPDEFQPHVEQFVIEANTRGLEMQIDNLIIRYDSSLDLSVCATCNSNSLTENIQKIVLINKNNKCWNNDSQLEALIFHELGHCILGRPHTSELLPNGDPKSLMIANNISVYATCEYDIGGGDCDQTYKREYYLDELFDEDTPVPDWAK